MKVDAETLRPSWSWAKNSQAELRATRLIWYQGKTRQLAAGAELRPRQAERCL